MTTVLQPQYQGDEIEYRLPRFLETQQAFRQLLAKGHPSGEDHILVLAYVGGWGSGKSTIGKWTVFDHMMLYPQMRTLICRKTLSSLQTTTKAEFLENMSEGSALGDNMAEVFKKRFNAKTEVYTHQNGSSCQFGGLDRPSKWGSSQFGLILMEEASECDREDLTYLKSRCRQGRPVCRGCAGNGCDLCEHSGNQWSDYKRAILLVANHVPETHWLYEDFVGTEENPKKPGYHIVETSSWENTHLPDGYLESMSESEDELTVSVFINGTWGVMPKGVPCYPFQAKVQGRPWHVQKTTYDPTRPLYWSFDFGYRFPYITFWQIQSRGRVRCLAELTVEKTQTGQLIEIAQSFAAENFPKWKAPVVYGDPAARQRRSEGDRDADTVEEMLGLPFVSVPSTHDSKVGRRKVLGRMLRQTSGEEALFAIDDSRCRRLKEAFEVYYRYPDVKQTFGRSNYDENPIEEHPWIDVMHSAEYFVVNHFRQEATAETIGKLKGRRRPGYKIRS